MRRDGAFICRPVRSWTAKASARKVCAVFGKADAPGLRLGASVLFIATAGPSALAQEVLREPFLAKLASDPLTFSALFAAAVVFFWAYLVIRKLIREEQAAERRARELETALNESEAILTAEPTMLIIWHGREGRPNRVTGDMKGVVKIPVDEEMLLDFPAWLDLESADALNQAGIKAVSYTSPDTGHEFQTWRRSLHEMAPLLFQD